MATGRSPLFHQSRRRLTLSYFVAACLRYGDAPMRAVHRAQDALDWIIAERRMGTWGRKHQTAIFRFVVAGLEAGGEAGRVVAAKAIESYRLISEVTHDGRGRSLSRAVGDAAPSSEDDDAA